MDPQVVTAHQHTYEEDPQNRGLHAVIDGEDEHHEKKSVLKKVKDKAKKLKDTLGIKKHGHGHEEDHDQEVEEDEDEEEIEQDPEVHGAPMYEVKATRIVLVHKDTLGQSGGDLGPKSQFPPLEKDPWAEKNQFEPSNPGNHQANATDLKGPGGKEAGITPLIGSFGKMEISNEAGELKLLSSTESHDQPSKTQTMGENFQAVPKILNTRESDNHSQGNEFQEPPIQSSYTEKNQFEPSNPGNHQANATDLKGPGEKEAGITPLIGSFGKMEISNEAGELKPLSSTESHDQPSKTQPMGENFQAVPKILNTGESDNHSQGNEFQEQPNQSSYTEKISAATSAIAEKAKSAKNAVASTRVGEYGNKVAATVTENLAPVYEKVAEAGTTVVSKIQGTGTEGKDVGGTNKGVSVKEYVAEKLRPSDEDKALSEVITEALHKRKGEEPQESKPQGRVTESPELARRLGADTDGNTPEGFSQGNETGKGTVDWLKGTVRSWLGKNGEQQQPQQRTSQESHSSSPGGGDDVGRQDIAGERRLNKSN